jgi:2-amino-4-hydroxy-6-hydroxymethyldihydropteridine diphosphokinase
MGNRLENLQKALCFLENLGEIKKVSKIYETQAWGFEQQPNFYNQVIELETTLPATTLIQNLLEIETKMGRTRQQKWAERIIDLDILYFGNEIINQTDILPHLQIPHPHLHERRFVLMPLVEIAPDFEHIILKKTNQQLLNNCTDMLSVEEIKT